MFDLGGLVVRYVAEGLVPCFLHGSSLRLDPHGQQRVSPQNETGFPTHPLAAFSLFSF